MAESGYLDCPCCGETFIGLPHEVCDCCHAAGCDPASGPCEIPECFESVDANENT